MIEEQVNQIMKNSNSTYNLFSKINYYMGVPAKYLSKKIIKSKKDLIKVIEKYSKHPTEFEKDLEFEFSGITNW